MLGTVSVPGKERQGHCHQDTPSKLVMDQVVPRVRCHFHAHSTSASVGHCAHFLETETGARRGYTAFCCVQTNRKWLTMIEIKMVGFIFLPS